MKLPLSLFILATLCLFLSFSCSKKSSTPPCKLISIVDAAGISSTTYDISYGSNSQITGIVATGSNASTKTYAYTGDELIITWPNGSNTITDSILLINDLIAYSHKTDTAINLDETDIYTYNSSGQIQQSTDQAKGGAITTTTYTFSNGDLTSSFDGTNTTTYTYYTDKAFADGDVLKENQLLNNGGLFIKNTHLIKSIQTVVDTQNFVYTFDSDGKIIGVINTFGPNTETFSDQYDCA